MGKARPKFMVFSPDFGLLTRFIFELMAQICKYMIISQEKGREITMLIKKMQNLKDETKMSYQDIADKSGIPISTVKRIFFGANARSGVHFRTCHYGSDGRDRRGYEKRYAERAEKRNRFQAKRRTSLFRLRAYHCRQKQTDKGVACNRSIDDGYIYIFVSMGFMQPEHRILPSVKNFSDDSDEVFSNKKNELRFISGFVFR